MLRSRSMTLSAALLLGLGMGIKHALEADHLAAVCTMVTAGGGVARAAKIGALWGLGHGLMIVLSGSFIVLLGIRVPEPIAMLLDSAVALMLIGLGISGLLSIQHHLAKHSAVPPRNLKKPLAVGAVHGASGTAALTLLVASTIPDRAQGLAFIFLFGTASIAGMALVSALVALPLQSAQKRSPRLSRSIHAFAGLASIGAGFAIAWSVTSALLA